ncbi:hypothetical protein [Candidatus Villigracilis saccharophilus]|uniref:hypothetical protein n=1 Tax=Candidatus Villigracilis saccharophilus TaxID=3140684 RepID=UPI003134807E|nr:hypothetical protein [Anaerolineales bacterium]
MKRYLILLWLAWFVLIYGFQWVATTRTELQRPDRSVFWSAGETTFASNSDKIYLNEPFMNRQVAWDSEYYLGIAVGGYDDPEAGRVQNPATGQMVIKNYSFFPFYPYIMRALVLPLNLFGLSPIGTATLAGLIVTLLGTLAGMFALWDLTLHLFDEETAQRAIFYMLIFPSAFFFAQIYTEGLFVGLAFSSLALTKRKQWALASLLGMLAALTRAHGAALCLPLIFAWIMNINWKSKISTQVNWEWLLQGLFALLPFAAYFIWRISPLGEGWAELQSFYFGRGLMSIQSSVASWYNAFAYARATGQEALIYFSIEVLTTITALLGSIWLIRRDPIVSLFSLAVVLLSIFSGSAQSMARYMLIAPAMFIMLGHLGKNKVFDKAWTLASILLMGMSVLLFSFDLWVG